MSRIKKEKTNLINAIIEENNISNSFKHTIKKTLLKLSHKIDRKSIKSYSHQSNESNFRLVGKPNPCRGFLTRLLLMLCIRL